MTTPAPSPEPAKRSRRIYVYWGIALTLLLALGLFCWVAVPLWQADRAADRLALEFERTRLLLRFLGGPANTTLKPSTNATLKPSMIWWVVFLHKDKIDREAAQLGGQRAAARKMHAYLRLPGVNAKKRFAAICVLMRCSGPAAQNMQLLADIASDEREDRDVRVAAEAALMSHPDIEAIDGQDEADGTVEGGVQ